MGFETPLLPHAGERHGLPRRLAAGRDCRCIHDALNAAYDGHDCERLIGPDALSKARLCRWMIILHRKTLDRHAEKI